VLVPDPRYSSSINRSCNMFAYLDLFWQHFTSPRSLSTSLSNELVKSLIHGLNLIVDLPYRLIGLRS
jgi:hypothetical protein